MIVKRKGQAPAKYEILTIPFAELSDEVVSATADLGELEENEFRGMASVFGMVVDAFTPTIMQRGAFTKTIKERSRAIPILWQHDMWDPIGLPTRLFEDENGLVLQARISRTDTGRKALTLMRDGVVRALSIGFEPVQFDFEEQPDGSMIRFVREARLVEISVVTLGADPNAMITEVRSGSVAGKLEEFVLNPEEPEMTGSTPTTEKETPELIAQFSSFLAGVEKLSDYESVIAFAATLQEVGPEETPPTLSEIDEQFMAAELLAAKLTLDIL